MKNLQDILDEWEQEVVERKTKRWQDYINTAFTKEEAQRHADNLQNLQVGAGEVAMLTMKLLVAGLLTPTTKPHLVLLKDNSGDWAALYVDGKCTAQGHSIHKDEILEAVAAKGLITYQEVECETEDRFPQELPADLPQLPGYIG